MPEEERGYTSNDQKVKRIRNRIDPDKKENEKEERQPPKPRERDDGRAEDRGEERFAGIFPDHSSGEEFPRVDKRDQVPQRPISENDLFAELKFERAKMDKGTAPRRIEGGANRDQSQ